MRRTLVRKVGQESVSLQAVVPWCSSCNGLMGEMVRGAWETNYFRYYKRLGSIAKLATSYVVVLKVVALIFQGIERLIFNLPARPTTPHELIDVTLAYPQVCHPTKVLPLVLANLQIIDEIDPYVSS